MEHNVLHIKKNLISRIGGSDDLAFLKALQTIFDSSEKELFRLNEAQLKAIDKGREEIRNGECKSHEQVVREGIISIQNT